MQVAVVILCGSFVAMWLCKNEDLVIIYSPTLLSNQTCMSFFLLQDTKNILKKIGNQTLGVPIHSYCMD